MILATVLKERISNEVIKQSLIVILALLMSFYFYQKLEKSEIKIEELYQRQEIQEKEIKNYLRNDRVEMMEVIQENTRTNKELISVIINFKNSK